MKMKFPAVRGFTLLEVLVSLAIFGLAAVMLVWGILMDRLIVLANQTQPPRLDSAAIGMLTACFLAATGAAVLWLLLKFLRKPTDTGTPDTSPS